MSAMSELKENAARSSPTIFAFCPSKRTLARVGRLLFS